MKLLQNKCSSLYKLSLALLFCLSVLCLAGAALAESTEAVLITPLPDWSFSKDGVHWEAVTLPHTCNSSDGMSSDMYLGVGYYKCTLTVSAQDAGRTVYFVSGGVAQECTVSLNGVSLGQYKTGYTPFCVPLTGLTAGDNELLITCSNAKDCDRIPVSADFNFNLGMHRNAYLVSYATIGFDEASYGVDRMHITPSDISAARATVTVACGLLNTTPDVQTADLTVTLLDADDQIVAEETRSITLPAAQVTDLETVFTLSDPHLWAGKKDPYCYRATLSLSRDSLPLDTQTAVFGIRTFSYDSQQGFLLNGEPYALRGVALHQDSPSTMSAVTEADLDVDYAIIEDLGCTFLRLAHYPHSTSAFDRCDAMGIIVQTEIPWVNHYGEAASDAYRAAIEENLRSMILNYYNHPSIAFWGLSNELGGTHWKGGGYTQGDYSAEQARLYNNQMYALAKKLDSTRMVGLTIINGRTLSSANAAQWDADWYALNLYCGWYSGAFVNFGQTLDSFKGKYDLPDRMICVGEYGAGANPATHSETPQTTTETGTGGKRHDEEYQNLFHESHLAQIQSRPWLGYTSVWALFDFAVAGRYEGDLPFANDKGLVTRDRSVMKDAFYLYKAAWNDEPLCYLTSKRFTERAQTIAFKAYANTDFVTLYVDDVAVETLASATSCGVIWQFSERKLTPGNHTIRVRGMKNGIIALDEVTILALGNIEFLSQPASFTAFEGNVQHTLSAVAEGAEQLTYQWLLNGELIPGATSAEYTLPTDLAAGAYDYACMVSGLNCQSALSETAQVRIAAPARSIDVTWPSRTIYALEMLDLTQISVTADGQPIDIADCLVTGALFPAEGENELTVSYGEHSRSMTFTAQPARYDLVTSAKSDNNHAAFVWTALDLPAGTYAYRIEVGGGNDNAISDEVVVRTAADPNDADGAILFSKTNMECNGGKTFEGIFTLPEPVPYLYLAFSSITNSTFDANIYLAGNIIKKINILQQPEQVTAFVGDIEQTLSVSAEGTGELSYQWQCNGKAIKGATESDYSLPADLRAGTYTYACVISSTDCDSVTSEAVKATIVKPVDSIEVIWEGETIYALEPLDLTQLSVTANGQPVKIAD